MKPRFEFVGSGSKGNATLIQYGATLIQVDMGVSLRRLNEALEALGKGISDISAVLVTHEHHDHVGTLPLLKKRGVRVYASHSTVPDLVDVDVSPLHPFSLGEIEVLPFSSSHDASDPLNYLFSFGDEKLAYVTDTGIIRKENKALLKDCSYYLFESNFDKRMLETSDRPYSLIARIKGKNGHLGNEESAKYMASFIGPNTKKIYLAHLSEDCNTPSLALKAYEKVFKEKKVAFHLSDIVPLKQWERVEGKFE